jgi:hypothetical protein
MKKNLRKVPHQVLDRLNTIELDDIVVACAKRLKIQDIGRYAHLGLAYENGRLVLPPPSVPNAKAGKYSTANVEGKDVIRRDLPMVQKSYSWDTGTLLIGVTGQRGHTRTTVRKTYTKEILYHPKN